MNYIHELAIHNPAAFFMLRGMLLIICLAMFHPKKYGGNGW